MALYHRLSILLHCNVKIVKSEYSCTIVQNIHKNIEQYNIKEFNKKIYFFTHLNKFHP